MTECKWPKCIEEGCTPMARQFASCYDTPSTPEDRAKVRLAAMTRAARMRRIADRLDEEADKLKWHDHALYFTCLDAADELRLLASGV